VSAIVCAAARAGHPPPAQRAAVGRDVPVEQSLEALSSRYLAERQKAVASLIVAGHDVLPKVLRCTRSKSHLGRMAAVEVLGEIIRKGDETRVGELLSASEYADVRRGIAEILPNTGAPVAAGYVKKALYDRDPLVRAAAARSLARFENAPGAERLHMLLRDESAAVRAAACDTLGRMNYAPAREDIAKLLTDAFIEVRLEAATALGRMGRQGTTRLIDVVVSGKDPRLRARAALALGQLGGPAAAHACAAALTNDDSEVVRDAARRALGSLSPHAEPAITRALSQGDVSRRALSLRRVAPVGRLAIPALLHMLEHDPYDRLRDEASRHLRAITEQRFGYAYDATEVKRREAIEAWKRWWVANR
jgi:HEAT repeat protein